MSAPKCLFIFNNSFSLRLTENLHKQKKFSNHDLHVLFIQFFSKVDNKEKLFTAILVQYLQSMFFFLSNEHIWSADFKTVVQFSKFILLFKLQDVILCGRNNTAFVITHITTMPSVAIIEFPCLEKSNNIWSLYA